MPPIDGRVKAQILEKQAEYGYAVLEMEVMPDPVHLLLDEVQAAISVDAV